MIELVACPTYTPNDSRLLVCVPCETSWTDTGPCWLCGANGAPAWRLEDAIGTGQKDAA